MVDDYHHNKFGWQKLNVNEGRDQNISNEVVNVSGDYVRNYNPLSRNPHKSLWDAVAGVGATHTAEQQYERGECLEGTRVELRGMIGDWGRAREQGSPLFWLTGTAGVGKTAIAMSAAKACEEEGLLVSSFFFFRPDPKRNNPNALWLSIAHGLASTMPDIRPLIERRISEDPKILEARLEEQFRELIVNPLVNPVFQSSWQRRLCGFLLQALCLIVSSVMLLDVLWGFWATLSSAGPAQVPDIVIIDGLDECSGEAAQLRILSIIQNAVRRAPRFPLRFLICSRPEAWIREAFSAEPLREVSKVILLDDQYTTKEDIIKYYRHQFQEIVNNPKYKHVRFPNPWPSQEDFVILIDRSSHQFVYVTTVVRFITLAGNHPIDQLSLTLQSSPNDQTGTSPFHELDILYNTILKASAAPERVHAILTAILVLSAYSSFIKPSPAHIELLLGLSTGQVALTLRGMHAVLHINGWADKIHIHHTSFRDYLVDPSRSQKFYIDPSAQKHFIMQQWLEKLTTSKMRAYSNDQLYGLDTMPVFVLWLDYCNYWFPKPTRELLECLQNVDLSSTLICEHLWRTFNRRPLDERFGYLSWPDAIAECRGYVQKYDNNQIVGDVIQYSAADDTAEAEQKADEDCNSSGDPLVDGLLAKYSQCPDSFHLDLSPGVDYNNDFVRWATCWTTGCVAWALESNSRMPLLGRSYLDNLPQFRLTDCSCNLTGRKLSEDPKHIAYQDACLQLLKFFILEFQVLSYDGPDKPSHIQITNLDYDLDSIFIAIVSSSLLQHCRLDAELLSLCHTFFDYTQRPSAQDEIQRALETQLATVHEPVTKLLEWIETFPVDLTEEGEALKAQVLSLPWVQ
ncbi:hypothetical protein PM082_017170 [Marasmius tenuissimus]|nr:hypothetical protein PM082_017170 [Marasmius tenuissimus]